MTLQITRGSQNREDAGSPGVSYAPEDTESKPMYFAETFDNRKDGIWLRGGIDSIWTGSYAEERLYSSTSKIPLVSEQLREIARKIVNYRSHFFVKMADGQMRVLQPEDAIAKHFRQ